MRNSTDQTLGRCDAGTSAIEFALIVPVFLTFVAGILAYGIYFGATYSVQQLSADAARASVPGLTNAERKKLATDFVTAAAQRYALIVPAKIVTTADPPPNDANAFEVAVSYDASALPIWNFANFLPLPNKTIRRTSVVKRGGF